jgi:hypothetical protein
MIFIVGTREFAEEIARRFERGVPPSGFQVLVPWDEWRRFQVPVPHTL